MFQKSRNVFFSKKKKPDRPTARPTVRPDSGRIPAGFRPVSGRFPAGFRPDSGRKTLKCI
jgi:hypothetical protein